MSRQSTSPFQVLTQTRAAPAEFYSAEGYSSDKAIGYLMRRIVLMVVNQVDRRLESLDLTQAQWGPLFLILQGRASTLAELSRDLQIDPGALTRTLDRLEAKGLCKRERSTEDRRVVNLVLTEEGRAAASHVPQVLAEVQNLLLAGFSETEWHTLLGLLNRVMTNAEAMRDGCAFGGEPDSSGCPDGLEQGRAETRVREGDQVDGSGDS